MISTITSRLYSIHRINVFINMTICRYFFHLLPTHLLIYLFVDITSISYLILSYLSFDVMLIIMNQFDYCSDDYT